MDIRITSKRRTSSKHLPAPAVQFRVKKAMANVLPVPLNPKKGNSTEKSQLAHLFVTDSHSEGMGKVLFSQVSVCSHFGGGVAPIQLMGGGGVPHPSQWEVTPILPVGRGGGVPPSFQVKNGVLPS